MLPKNVLVDLILTTPRKKIGTDRVIIENFYGRMKLTWGLIRNKYKGSHADYDAIFEIAYGLTNILLKYSPLRAEDGQYYIALQNELLTKNIFKKKELKDKRKEWRKKRLTFLKL